MKATRRRFLTYLGIGTYALLRHGWANGWATGWANVSNAAEPTFPLARRRGPAPDWFKPIRPSTEDRLIVPDGYRAEVVCAWGDPLGSSGPHGPEAFGYDADFIAYFPIDALSGGTNSDEGLLWVNHENANSVFVSKVTKDGKKNQAHVLAEKLAIGGSVIHVQRQARDGLGDRGAWKHLPGSKFTRRFTGLYPKIELSGPVAQRVPQATGTLANCSGGRTPWHTVLSCEENFQDYNGAQGEGEYGGLRWAEVPGQKVNEEEYGWVVEIDPFGELPPVKHSCLGRFAHENAAWRLSPGGRLVVYMGDDAADQFLYKYVSAEKYDPKAPRAQARRLLTDGTLYVADFARCRWAPLDLSRTKELATQFTGQAHLLLNCRDAAKLAGGTPIDRPEDCEVHPGDGSLYVALSNNKKHGNFFGQVVRLLEDKDNPEEETFRFELFLAGGPQTGLACPDNLMFDKKGNLWVACDMSTQEGPYRGFGNNGLFVVPTAGASAGEAFQFASGPVDCELTGPWMNEREDTLFLSVQHPGARSPSHTSPTSRWPRGGEDLPRPAVVAITGFPQTR